MATTAFELPKSGFGPGGLHCRMLSGCQRDRVTTQLLVYQKLRRLLRSKIGCHGLTGYGITADEVRPSGPHDVRAFVTIKSDGDPQRTGVPKSLFVAGRQVRVSIERESESPTLAGPNKTNYFPGPIPGGTSIGRAIGGNATYGTRANDKSGSEVILTTGHGWPPGFRGLPVIHTCVDYGGIFPKHWVGETEVPVRGNKPNFAYYMLLPSSRKSILMRRPIPNYTYVDGCLVTPRVPEPPLAPVATLAREMDPDKAIAIGHLEFVPCGMIATARGCVTGKRVGAVGAVHVDREIDEKVSAFKIETFVSENVMRIDGFPAKTGDSGAIVTTEVPLPSFAGVSKKIQLAIGMIHASGGARPDSSYATYIGPTLRAVGATIG